jgi:hypothetical protein
MAATNPRAWAFLEDFWNASMTKGKYRYYDGCLYMLGLLHVTGNFKAYLRSNTTPTPPTPSASISPSSVTFDKYTSHANYGNKTITVTLPDTTYSLSSITNGSATLASGTNYTTSGSGTSRTVVLQSSYLSTLAVGSTTLTFNFNKGNSSTLTVTVNDSTPPSSISPATAAFNQTGTVATTMTLNGNTLSSITRNGAALTSGSGNNYSVSGSTVTFSNAYLVTLPNGNNVFIFNFSAGASATFTITVTGSDVSGGGSTSYDFTTDPGSTVYRLVGGSNTTTLTYQASAGGTNPPSGGVLQLAIGSSQSNNATVYIKFKLPAGETLQDYTKLRIHGAPTAVGQLEGTIYAAQTGTATASSPGTTLLDISGSGNFFQNNDTWQDKTFTFNSSSRTGFADEFEIGIRIKNYSTGTFQIKSIELIK